MARQYGGFVGKVSEPSTTSAAGAWVEGTEAQRQVGLLKWPILPFAGNPTLDAGAYVYLLSSGTADFAVDSGTMVIANGQSLSTTTYADLFEVTGYTYGGGGASFNVPNLLGDFKQHRSATTSGLSLSTINLSGTLPQHKHTCNVGDDGCPTRGDDQFQQSFRKCYDSTASGLTGFYGDPDGNVGRHRHVVPALVTKESFAPPGTLIPIMMPVSQEQYSSFIKFDEVQIASGQDLSRTEYPQLFKNFGTFFGTGDGSSTFGTPDMRGLFVKCNDGTAMSGTLTSGYVMDALAQHEHDVTLYYKQNTQSTRNGGGRRCLNGLSTPSPSDSDVGTGDETRPANISVVWCLVTSYPASEE